MLEKLTVALHGQTDNELKLKKAYLDLQDDNYRRCYYCRSSAFYRVRKSTSCCCRVYLVKSETTYSMNTNSRLDL